MEKFEIDDLVAKCKTQNLNKDEISFVVDNLQDDSDFLYDCIYILGRMGLTDYESKIAKYLSFIERPDVVKVALLVLCDYWDGTAKYISYLKAYAENAEWDFTDEVRLVCITLLGKFLFRQNKKFDNNDRIVIELLLRIYADSDGIISMEAYRSLCLSAGDETMKSKIGSDFVVDAKILSWAESLNS